MPDAAPLEPGDPRSLGQYEVLGRLGAGGQGAVFLGRTGQGEYVAIKLLHAQYAADPSARARFTREVTAAQKVEAFCTARVIEADLHGDQPYVVSEFIDGPSLHDVVAMHGPRSQIELERLAIGTITALAAIHEAGIVHRDFKPNNVMLAADGPRVVDFGIARTINSQESKVTATGMVVGTPGYLAPEQLTGAPLQPSVDIFAWGAAMVFAATGSSPFDADTLPVIINRILNDEPDLSAIQPPLRGLIAQALAKDPAQRPTAAQLLLQLLGNAGAAPGPAPARDDLLAQGTQLAAQLPAPPAMDRTALAPPIVRPGNTAPPMTPPPMPQPSYQPQGYQGPTTPPPMQQPGYQGQGYQGPTTLPPMQQPGFQGPMTPPTLPVGMQQPGFLGPSTPPPIQMGMGGMPPGIRPGPPPRRSSNTPLIVGIGCGAAILLAVILIVVAVVANTGPTNYTSSPAYSPTDTSVPTDGGQPTQPAGTYSNDYEGTWTGRITDVSNGKWVDAKVNLYPLLGTGLVSYSLKSSTCFGDLKLVRNNPDKVVMSETISYGRSSCGDGYETLSLSGGSLKYEFRKNLSEAGPEFTGTLTKS